MIYTIRATVFIARGDTRTCFLKSTTAIVDKTKQYPVYIPELSKESLYYGADLINPFVVFKTKDEETTFYLPDYQI